MKQRSTELAACYELSPAREKQLGGELTLDFTVEATDKISGESLVSDSMDTSRCVCSGCSATFSTLVFAWSSLTLVSVPAECVHS